MADDQKDNVEEDPPIGGDRLVKIELDEAVTPRRSAEAEHERAIAIYDILEENNFSLVGQAGPFHLYLRKLPQFLQKSVFNTNCQIDQIQSILYTQVWK